MFDPDSVIFDDWNEKRTMNTGLRHKETRKRHGIVRILTDESMEEATWKQGKRHGFSRLIGSSGIMIQLLIEGEEQARLYLNNKFERLTLLGNRNDLLLDFHPMDLIPEDSVLFYTLKLDPYGDFPSTEDVKK